MDWEAFEKDVLDSVNESAYTEQWGSLDDSSPEGDYTGIVVTIGETWIGSLYGYEEYADGQRKASLFETEQAQREWFDGVVAVRS